MHPNPRQTSSSDLLSAADLLLTDDRLPLTPTARHRGAALALRIALEIAVDLSLSTALPPGTRPSMRARLLCLRYTTDPETARRTRSLWAHLCLGCHYHHYEMGPSADQIRTWRTDVIALVTALSRQ